MRSNYYQKKGAALFLCLCILSGLHQAVVIPVYAAESKTYEQIKILVDIMGYIKENHFNEVETKQLVYGAAKGMVKTLDPFSQFMEPPVHKEMKVETKGEFGGLGIRISITDSWLTVITPLPGTPAYMIGILPNDRIIKIEGESTHDISLIEAVEKLRGKPKTKVTITVSRIAVNEAGEETTETRDFTITRDIIKIESVRSKVINDETGYVRLIEFTKNTAKDMRTVLDEFRDLEIKNIILDLRNNPGGLLDVAVDVCDEFLEKGKMIVYTQGRGLARRQEFLAVRTSRFEKAPLIVLINEGSASGSEIVAGALKDNKRAVIIGARTFGKASVQSVIPLSDGSGLRLTTAHYYTLSGTNLHRSKDSKKWGIDPDIKIVVPREIQIKLRQQSEIFYSKEEKTEIEEEKKDLVQDEVLNRALEIFKARELFKGISTFSNLPEEQDQ